MGFEFDSLDRIVADAVDTGAVPHLAVVVSDRDGVVAESAHGPLAVGRPEPLTTSSPFAVLSMTKLVTTVAALQLVEREDVELHAPVDSYCPEFAGLEVLTGESTPRPPHTRATVANLLTHTTGLAYDFWSADKAAFEAELARAGRSITHVEEPLFADPGTRFLYGTSTQWLGRVIEAVTASTLDRVFAEAVTEPLTMMDTGFGLTDAQVARAAHVHVRGDEGWSPTGLGMDPEPSEFAAGHGLFSTPRDYARLTRLLLRGGELDGVRLLQPSTVAAMFVDQLDGAAFPAGFRTARPDLADDLELGEGWTFGHGLLVNLHAIPGRRCAGSGSWGGLYNTLFMIDPTTGVSIALFASSLPFMDRRGAWHVFGDIERAVYASIANG